jgi:hypothetical protein
MGVEGIENLTPGDDDTPKQEESPRLTDQELKDKQEAELAAEREEHNRRTAGGDPR